MRASPCGPHWSQSIDGSPCGRARSRARPDAGDPRSRLPPRRLAAGGKSSTRRSPAPPPKFRRRLRPARDHDCRRSRSNRDRAAAAAATRDPVEHARGTIAIMKTVAERDHRARRVTVDRQAPGAPASLRYHRAAAARRARRNSSLFQGAGRRRPEDRSSGQYSAPAGVGEDCDARDHNLDADRAFVAYRQRRHCIASFTSSASTSASTSSDASP